MSKKPVRIIARLDMKGPNVVKGIHLEGLRVVGRPELMAPYYYAQGADEIFYQDVVASLYERNSLKDIVSQTAMASFIPLCVGGGIRTIDDIRVILRSGADKVSINTAAIKDPEFIRKAAQVFGSSTIVVALEAIKQYNGHYYCFTDNGREYTGIDALEWAKRAEDLGAGELLVISVDKDGTGSGFEVDLIAEIRSRVKLPVIAHGGAGNKEQVLQVIRETDVDAVCIASCLHYYYVANQTAGENRVNPEEGNFEFLSGARPVQRITPFSIAELKKYLLQQGILIRE